VRQLSFLRAIVPDFGRSLLDQVVAEPELYDPVMRGHPGRMTGSDGATWFRDEAAARDVFYHDCTAADVDWAFARLRRQAVAPRREPCPLSVWPTGERAYILCRKDRAISSAGSRASAWVSSRSSSTGAIPPSSRGPRFLPVCSTALRADLARAGRAAMLRCSRPVSGCPDPGYLAREARA
jgi:hypothetical protein